jgi:glycosyltransferase involved in cell wall biosynthesis
MPEDRLVSFVIIAYNEAENIARSVATINALEGLGKHEILVVDDGSSDGTAQIVSKIARQDAAVRLIDLAQNHGRGYARSRGIAAARGDLIATVDGDILLPPDWLVRASSALRDYDAVGGIAVPDGDVQYVYHRFSLIPRVVPGTTKVTGSNGLYRREVFDLVNFDPRLREGEDSALNHAMDSRGLSAATVPGLVVQHRENKKLGASLRWLFDVGRGATRQLVTYRNVRQPDIVTGAFVGSAALGCFVAVEGHYLIGAALPVSLVVAASVQHVRSRFETPPSHWSRVAGAIAADSALIMAYLAGRLAGLTAVWRRPRPS